MERSSKNQKGLALMDNQESRSSARLAVSIILVVVIGASVIGAAYLLTSQSASSTASTSETSNSIAEDALLNVPGLPTLYHEDCATPYPNGTSTTCTTTTSTVGIPQTFNMSTDFVSSGGMVSGILHEHLFAFELKQKSTIQFTYKGVEPGSQPAAVSAYFDDNQGVNFTDLRGQVDSGVLRMVTNSSSVNFPVDRFSGLIVARPGVYIFDFQTTYPSGGAAYFIVRDATALQQGIEISVGSPKVDHVSFGSSACGGGPGEEGFVGEEEFPVTVTVNTTTDVDLTSPNVPSGVWVQFVPSQLEDVGPQGANATLLLAGDVDPFGGNVWNSSLFIDASGSTAGLTGETVLPLDSAYGDMDVLQSVGPVGQVPTPNPGALFSQGTTPSTEQNQTNYALLRAVYDPSSGTPGSSSLSVTITGVGLMQNGTEVPFPDWLKVTTADSSFAMSADQPYYLQVCVRISTSTPQGSFTIVLNEKVDGQPFSGEFVLEITDMTFG
jgi:hypothetical protein